MTLPSSPQMGSGLESGILYFQALIPIFVPLGMRRDRKLKRIIHQILNNLDTFKP
jgi:hypothetical protein